MKSYIFQRIDYINIDSKSSLVIKLPDQAIKFRCFEVFELTKSGCVQKCVDFCTSHAYSSNVYLV